MDVRGNVEEALGHVTEAMAELDKVYAAYAEPDADFDALAKRQAELENILQASDGHNLERQLEVAADALRLPPWDADVTKLSGGERRRVALCRLLLSQPDMLLLDEPTNHLDAESVAWLERFLDEYPSTVIAVTHDRYFLDNVAGWILELDRGHGIPWEGNYSSWLEQKRERLAREERSNLARQKSLERELEWVRLAPRARQAKSKQKQLERIVQLKQEDLPMYASAETRTSGDDRTDPLLQGKVSVRYEVSTRGRAANLELIEASPPEFERMANTVLREVRRQVFRPRLEDGAVVDTTDLVLVHKFFYRQSDLDAVRAEQDAG